MEKRRNLFTWEAGYCRRCFSASHIALPSFWIHHLSIVLEIISVFLGNHPPLSATWLDQPLVSCGTGSSGFPFPATVIGAGTGT